MYTILGATGNIGSKIVDILLRSGEKVKAVARTAEKLAPLAARGAEVHVGDLKDTVFLTKVIRGSKSVFALIPPHYTAADFSAYQDEVGASITQAVRDAGVTHVVNLSSVGAGLPGGTGPIAGLYRQEARLNAIPILNVLHIRPAYFMENLLMNVPLIRTSGIMGSAIKGDLAMYMIATRDIARIAADHLVKRDFSGSVVEHLLGGRKLTLEEFARILAPKIGVSGLKYIRFSYEEAEKGLRAAGLSPDVSRLFIEMSAAFNEGRIAYDIPGKGPEPLATSIEEFAEVFARIYRMDAMAA